MLPQAFKDRVHARQLAGVVQESGAKDESSRSGTLTFNMNTSSEARLFLGPLRTADMIPHPDNAGLSSLYARLL